MKILNLTIGAILTWFGAAKVSADNSAVIGWFFLAVGIITIPKPLEDAGFSKTRKG